MLMWNISWCLGVNVMPAIPVCVLLVPAATKPHKPNVSLSFLLTICGTNSGYDIWTHSDSLKIPQKVLGKISMRLRLRFFSVDVFWLAACWIVVWSTSSPFHPEKPKPCIGGQADQPPATLVEFGSSKVKVPFFLFFFPWSIYFEFQVLGSQGASSGEPAGFRHSCGLFKVSEQINWAWNVSPHQCSGTCCCDVSSERMEKPLAHLWELWCWRCCLGELPAGQGTVMGSASGWPVTDTAWVLKEVGAMGRWVRG